MARAIWSMAGKMADPFYGRNLMADGFHDIFFYSGVVFSYFFGHEFKLVYLQLFKKLI